MRALFFFTVLVCPELVLAASQTDTSYAAEMESITNSFYNKECQKGIANFSVANLPFREEVLSPSHVRFTLNGTLANSGKRPVVEVWCEFKDGFSLRHRLTWR